MGIRDEAIVSDSYFFIYRRIKYGITKYKIQFIFKSDYSDYRGSRSGGTGSYLRTFWNRDSGCAGCDHDCVVGGDIRDSV